ncbi:MAG: VWA domain-containing protein [Thermoanaerobaculia bacterium]|nr:VWA domain-containing protein [Thermoanaerobaculia bacterium]
MARQRVSKIRRFLLSTLVVAASAQAQAAREAAQDDLFFDTVEVNVVNVEVIVTDRDGVPIPDLGPDDFELLEDGQPVKLSNFFAVEGRETVRSLIGERKADDAASGPETQQLNLIVYIDDFNLTPQNRTPILKNLRKYLAADFDPRDQVMLVTFNGDVEIAQPFTNDLELLNAAIDKIEERLGRSAVFNAERGRILAAIDNARLFGEGNGGQPLQRSTGPVNVNDAAETELTARALTQEIRNFSEESYRRTRQTLRSLETFTDSLAGMRGRKAILYVSDGMSLRPSDSLVEAWLDKFERWVLNNGKTEIMRNLTTLSSTELDTTRDFEALVAQASANRVAFYPLSNAGRATSRISAQFSGSSVYNSSAGSPRPGDSEAFLTESSLLTLAEGTGGLAFTRSTNIGGLLDRMTGDFTTFYSLGYTPPADREAGFHSVAVKVRRDGAKVRHLKGYRQKDPLENLQDLALSAASTGLEDNELGVRLTPGEQTKSKGDRFQVQVMVQIPFEKLLLLPEAEHHSGRVTVYVVVRDLERSGISVPQRIELPIQIPNSRILEALGQVAAYPLQLDIEKGRKRISLGVRDNLARVDSTVSVELEVGGQG